MADYARKLTSKERSQFSMIAGSMKPPIEVSQIYSKFGQTAGNRFFEYRIGKVGEVELPPARFVLDFLGAATYSPELSKTIIDLAKPLSPDGRLALFIPLHTFHIQNAQGLKIEISDWLRQFNGLELVFISQQVKNKNQQSSYVRVILKRNSEKLEAPELTQLDFTYSVLPYRSYLCKLCTHSTQVRQLTEFDVPYLNQIDSFLGSRDLADTQVRNSSLMFKKDFLDLWREHANQIGNRQQNVLDSIINRPGLEDAYRLLLNDADEKVSTMAMQNILRYEKKFPKNVRDKLVDELKRTALDRTTSQRFKVKLIYEIASQKYLNTKFTFELFESLNQALFEMKQEGIDGPIVEYFLRTYNILLLKQPALLSHRDIPLIYQSLFETNHTQMNLLLIPLRYAVNRWDPQFLGQKNIHDLYVLFKNIIKNKSKGRVLLGAEMSDFYFNLESIKFLLKQKL